MSYIVDLTQRFNIDNAHFANDLRYRSMLHSVIQEIISIAGPITRYPSINSQSLEYELTNQIILAQGHSWKFILGPVMSPQPHQIHFNNSQDSVMYILRYGLYC